MRRTAVSNSPRPMQPKRLERSNAEIVKGLFFTLDVSDDLDPVIAAARRRGRPVRAIESGLSVSGVLLRPLPAEVPTEVVRNGGPDTFTRGRAADR